MKKSLLVGAALVFLVCAAPRLASAPAPFFPQEIEVVPNKSYFFGTWEVECGKYKSVVTFHKDGKYSCTRDGVEYKGTWLFIWGGLRIEETAGKEDHKFTVAFPRSSKNEFRGVLNTGSQGFSLGRSLTFKPATFRRTKPAKKTEQR